MQDGASRDLSRRQLALRRDQVQCARPRPGQHGGRSDRAVDAEGQTAARLPPRVGGRVCESQKRSSAAAMIVPLTLLVIFLILYTMFGSLKWAALILMNVAMAPIGGILALYLHGHQFQRVFGRRIPGAVRRLGADRRDHGRVHQPAARPRHTDRSMPRAKERCCASGPS